MPFTDLPNEIITDIIEALDEEQDIYSLVRVGRRFYNLFNDHLHCHNIKHRNCRALVWAAKHGRESTARKLLHLGADPNVKIETRGLSAGLMPLHMAAAKGHLAIVKLLLEVGADPEARGRDGLTPLFVALVARREEICARYFLNEGADVDATDARAMTPLHHALQADFCEAQFRPSPEDIFETVKVLMEFRANQNLESRPLSVGEEPFTARERGVNHPHDGVRALFSNHASYSLRIGRTWMLPSHPQICATERDGLSVTEHTDTERSFNSYHSTRTFNGDQRQPDNLDLSSFPFLDSANQPHIPSLKTDVSDGLWSRANIDSLIPGFSVVSEPVSKHNTEQGAQIHHHLSKPNSSISKKPLETEAGRLWADFGRPKVQPVAEQEYSNSANSEKNSPQKAKHTKVRGKARWQPLKL